MIKENKTAIIKFLLWFISLFIICFIGISKIFAEEVDIGYITNKTTISYENNDAQAMVSLPVQTNVNRYLYNLLAINISNQNILANNIYLLELYTPNAKLQNINEVHIVDGSSNVCQFFGTEDLSIGYPKIYFKCNQATNNLIITLNNTNPSTITNSITTGNNFQWNYAYLRYFTEDDDIDLGPIISSQNQNTQDIINNQNQNTQDVINNQNDLMLNKCPNLFNPSNFTAKQNVSCDSDGIITATNVGTGAWQYSNSQINMSLEKGVYQITIYFDTKETATSSGIRIFNSSNTELASKNNLSNLSSYTLTITLNSTTNIGIMMKLSNVAVARLQVEKSDVASPYCKYGSTTNKLDEQNKTSKGILGKLGDLFSTLFSNENADVSSLNNVAGWLPPGPVDSIINLPLSLFNSLLNTLTGTCSPVVLTLPFVNQILTLPCFSSYMSQYVTGFSTLWTLIGTIVSVLMLYRYLLSLYAWIDNTLTLRENNLPGYYDDNWGGGA